MMNARLASAVVAAATVLVWACDHAPHPVPSGASGGKGSDAGTGGRSAGGGGAGQGGASGSSGASSGRSGDGGTGGESGGSSGEMSGGSSGAGQGGRGTGGNGGTGNGAAASAGEAGEAGSPTTGGSAGTGGNSGMSGMAGIAGSGGTSGDTNNGEGGEWAGPDERTIDELCAEVCADQASVSCGFGTYCESQCVQVSAFADYYAVSEFRQLLECQAEHVTTENYENYCPNLDPMAGILAFEAGTPCDGELCAWTCSSANWWYFSVDVRYDRCNACL